MKRLSTVILTATLIAGTTLAAQQPGDTETKASPAQITLNFQDVNIRALISTVSEITGQNFVVDPRVKGNVTLVSGQKLNADQIYPVFLSVLEVHNFAAVPAGDVIKIVPSNLVKTQPTPTSFSRPGKITDDQITQVYQLKHGSVQALVPILRPLLPATSHFAVHAGTNTMVFTDTVANVQRILAIVERIDQPDRRSDVHVVYLKFARAVEMAKILSQITTSLGGRGDPKGKSSKKFSIQADSAINAVIIQAPESEFNLLQAVIDQLDIERPIEGDVHVISLKYARAKDLVQLLDKILQSSRGTKSTSGAKGKQAALSVQADEASNALVIHAPDDDFRVLKAVIAKLDKRRAQVFLETIIAEVSTTKAADIGVEWNFKDASQPTGQTTGSTAFSDFSGGLTLGFINDLTADIFGNIIPDLEIVLRALREDSNTNIMATPTLMTLDNQEAIIIVGQEVPFVTGQFISNASSTTVVPPADGGGGGGTASAVVNPFQTIQRKDIGLTLKVTPQINEDNTIRLDIFQEVSSVSQTTVEGASDLITDQRSIETTVQVDDGQIIVLGGLTREDIVDTVEWVPILGKIPVIGALFRRKSKSAVKRNLMIFLQPRIIRKREDLAKVTRSRYQRISTVQEGSNPDTKYLIDNANPPVLPEVDWIRQSQDPRDGFEYYEPDEPDSPKEKIELNLRGEDDDS